MPSTWIILALAAGFLGLWNTRRHATGAQRAAAVVLGVLLAALLFVYVETALLSTRWTWSACRLAPVVALFHGYPLYSPIETGPINGWLYGPVAALAWAPAALASSPQPALLIAATINLLFLLVPVALAAFHAAAGRRGIALAGFAAGAAVLPQLYPTWYMASALNVDAVAVGLGAVSCLLLAHRPPAARRTLVAAGALAALAVATKQTEAPLPAALLLWLLVTAGWRAAATFALAAAGTLLGVGALLAATTDPAALVFNLWTVPAAHARPGGWMAARQELVDFTRDTSWFWLLLAGALVCWRTARTGGGWPQLAASRPVLLSGVVLALLPTGILAAIKLGGDRNSIHSVYFLVLAVVATLALPWPARPGWQPIALLLAATAVTGLAVRQVRGYPELPMLPTRCLSQEAWQFARENPGRVYFPWDPLATVMADGKLYHFEYGVLDRHYARRAPDPARMARDLPAAPAFVVYPRADHPQIMLREYLPGYRFARATADWLLFQPGPP